MPANALIFRVPVEPHGAHPLQQYFAFGLVFLGKNALDRGLIHHRFFRDLPATPEVDFMAFKKECRAVGAVHFAPVQLATFRCKNRACF